MSERNGLPAGRKRIMVPFAKGALLLPLLVASCKSPQGAPVGDIAPGRSMTAPDTSMGTGGAMPSDGAELEPSSAALDQINEFLLNARTELLAQRDLSLQAAQASDNLRHPAPLALDTGSNQPLGPAEAVPQASTDATDATVVAEATVTYAVPASDSENPAAIDGAMDTVAAELADSTEPPPVDAISAWIKSLLTTASASDAPLRHHLTVAIVLGMSAPERSFKPEGLSELTEEEQELVRIVYEQFRVLGQDLELGGDSETVVEVLTGLIDQVQAEEPFRIARMNLCSWVRDFGDVDVIDPPTFAPTERSRFIWYIELAGVTPKQDAETGAWLYEFDLRLEMLTRDTGIPVIAPIEGTVRHSASSRVHDLFLRDLFEMPAGLQFDWYTAKLTITHRETGAQAQKSHELLWVPNLAAGASHIERRAAVAPAN